jgi:hypothetical protein
MILLVMHQFDMHNAVITGALTIPRGFFMWFSSLFLFSGHKSLRDFYKYKGISKDKTAQKIEELWHQIGAIASMNRHELKVKLR